jgi:hypothetical protein
VKTYGQCNIIWNYPPPLTVVEDFTNRGKDWLCVEIKPGLGSFHVIELGSIPQWGWTFLLVMALGTVAYLGGFGVMTHRRLGGQVDWKSEWLPHRLFWVGFGGMVLDGTRFSRAKIEERAVAAGYMSSKGDGGSAGSLREGLAGGKAEWKGVSGDARGEEGGKDELTE